MKNRKHYFLFIILGLLFVAGIVTGYFLFHEDGIADDKRAITYETKEPQASSAEKGRIIIPGYGTIQMEAGTNILKVALLNPKDNPCYFKFTLILDETEEVLFESKLIAPGKAIVEEELEKTLPLGTHPITIRIQTYDLNDRKIEMNGSELKANIVTFTSDEQE